MDCARGHGTIVTSMSIVSAELPLSPELVLVSPPEVASLARQLLGDPEQAPRPTAAAARATPSRLGLAAFYAFCVANCLAPLAITAVVVG